MVIKCSVKIVSFQFEYKNCYNYQSHEHCLVKSSKKGALLEYSKTRGS